MLKIREAVSPGIRAKILLPCCLILIMSGCVSLKKPLVPDYSSLIFEEGGTFVQLKPARNIELTRMLLLTAGIGQDDMDQIIRRTDDVFASYTWTGSGFSYVILAQGKFPDTAASLSLRKSREWKRIKDTYSWWEHVELPLQLSFATDNVICVSNGRMKETLSRLYGGPQDIIPEPIRSKLNSAALGIYSSRPNIPSQGIRLFEELESFWMTFQVESATQDFIVDAEYTCSTVQVARSLFLLMRLNLLNEMRRGGSSLDMDKLREKDPVRLEDRIIILEAYPLKMERLTWFFATVLPHIDTIINSEI